jgi:hypothetical protein
MKNEQAKFVENMFVGAVGGPLLLLGVAGLWTSLGSSRSSGSIGSTSTMCSSSSSIGNYRLDIKDDTNDSKSL